MWTSLFQTSLIQVNVNKFVANLFYIQQYMNTVFLESLFHQLSFVAIPIACAEWQFALPAGIEWSLDNDASNAAVLVASEAHAITLAVEGLLGVVFTVATLTDEAMDVGEVCVDGMTSFFRLWFPYGFLLMSYYFY